MAVRLYPRTDNVSVLEKLAGVPAGTHQRMEAMEKLPLEFFGRPEIVAKIAAGLKAHCDSDPCCIRLSLQGHFKEVRSDFRRDPEYVRYLYREHVAKEEGRLHSFMLYGWGRVAISERFLETSGKGNAGYSGSVTDLDLVREVLDVQIYRGSENWFDESSWLADRANVKFCSQTGSVFLSEIQGLYWC